MKRGDKFGDWEVVNSIIFRGKYSHGHILCYDEKMNILKYVRTCHLKNGTSKGAHKGNYKGWSTRNKFKSLPKHIYLWQSKNLVCKHQPFRVCKKIDGKTKTLGYFHKLEEAKEFTQNLD